MNWVGLKYNELNLSDKYLISDNGQIKNIITNKIRTSHFNKKGYVVCTLNMGGRNNFKGVSIHRAIMCSFTDGDYSLQINHIDGDKTNNLIYNLEFVSCKENIKHGWENKLYVPRNNEKNPFCKISNEVVKQIRLEYIKGKKGHSSNYLSDKYNISKSQILRIVKNEGRLLNA